MANKNGCGDSLLSSLNKYFNYSDFKNENQKKAMMAIVNKTTDVVISMPSGYGKTLCYQLPALIMNPSHSSVTIVISPSIAQIKDKIHRFKQYNNNIDIESISAETSDSEQKYMINKCFFGDNCIPIIYVTSDQIGNTFFQNFFKGLVSRERLARVVVDKAHLISPLSDFSKHYTMLGSLRQMYFQIPWVAITDIDNTDIIDHIISLLKLTLTLTIIKEPYYRDNFYYETILVDKQCFDTLISFIRYCLSKYEKNNSTDLLNKPCGIIFCKHNNRTEEISEILHKAKITVDFCHPGLNELQQKNALYKFSMGLIEVIVITNNLKMQIKKSNITFVVHMGMPTEIKKYYQETSVASTKVNKVRCVICLFKEENLHKTPIELIQKFVATEPNPRASFNTILRFIQSFENISKDKYEYLLNCIENKKHCERHIESDNSEVTNSLVQFSISNKPSEPEVISNSNNQHLVSSSNVRPKVEITEVQENMNCDNITISEENDNDLKSFEEKVNILQNDIETLFNTCKLKNPPSEVIQTLKKYKTRCELSDFMITMWMKSYPENVSTEEKVNLIDFYHIEYEVYKVTGFLSNEEKYRKIIFKIISSMHKNLTEKEIFKIISEHSKHKPADLANKKKRKRNVSRINEYLNNNEEPILIIDSP